MSAQAVMSRDGTAGPDIGNHTYSDETAAWLASRKPHCEVLTDDAFGIIVQVVLALLGFGALLLKRKYEHPRREFQVWALDVTKQAVSGAILHLFGMFSSGVMNHYTAHLDSGDHCSWYFISFSFGTVSHASAFSLRYAVSLTDSCGAWQADFRHCDLVRTRGLASKDSPDSQVFIARAQRGVRPPTAGARVIHTHTPHARRPVIF